MDNKDKKLDMLELQIEAIRAQEFARGYTAALQFVAKKAEGTSNEMDSNKTTTNKSKA